VSLLVNPALAKVGSTIEVGMRLEMPAGWHTYWRNPGDNGTPTSIKWTLPEGITAGDIQWPVPEKVEWLEMFTYAYHGEVLLIVPLTLAADLAPGEHTIKAKVDWLECEETCIPGEAEVSAKLIVHEAMDPNTAPGTTGWLFGFSLSILITSFIVAIFWDWVKQHTKIVIGAGLGMVTLLALGLWIAPSVQSGSTKTKEITKGTETKAGPHAEMFQKTRAQWPTKNELPELPAQWAGEANADGERTLNFAVPVDSKETIVHFLPFGTAGKKWEIAHNSTLTKGESEFTLTKTITSKAGQWPAEVRGVVRFETEGKVTSQETAFQIGAIKPEEELAKAPGESGSASGGSPKNDVPKSIWYILCFAFLGGMILNVMPCVLPVISMKILGFVQQSQEEPGRVAKLGFTYGLGVLFSFLVLAGFMVAAKEATGMAAWGKQMQNPYFTLTLTLVVMLVALNLFGVFEINLSAGAMNKANTLATREGYMGSFFNGILATALATPCTAPLLTSAIGAALSQSNGVIIGAMSAAGMGLAFPYVLLSCQPGWMKFLPKPGEWMVQFKQIMGFAMLAAAFWVMHFAGRGFNDPAPHKAIFWITVVGTTVALAAWVFGEFKQKQASASNRSLWVCAVLLLLAVLTLEGGLDWRHPKRKIQVVKTFVPPPVTDTNSSVAAKSDDGKLAWEKDWSPEFVASARSQGYVVLVDFTADWCASCQWTKERALDHPKVKAKLAEVKGVSVLADWTLQDDR
ncbi:MAG: protein-disulfide reductase DsbD family protein, partial [Limisphaerales bacterium]